MPFAEFEALAADVKKEAGDAYEVCQMVWAGPYELILSAIEQAAVSAAVGATVSVSLTRLFTRLAAAKSEYKFKVRLDDGTEFEITQDLPKELQEKFDQMARDHAGRFHVEGVSEIVEATPPDLPKRSDQG